MVINYELPITNDELSYKLESICTHWINEKVTTNFT